MKKILKQNLTAPEIGGPMWPHSLHSAKVGTVYDI